MSEIDKNRLEHRVATGRASYIHYYGLEGNSTHSNEFDSMYAELARLYTEGLRKTGETPEKEHQATVAYALEYSHKPKATIYLPYTKA